MDNNNTGIGILGLLGVMFIGLKLGQVIDWSWWWVLAPFWIPITLVIIVLFIILLVGIFIIKVR